MKNQNLTIVTASDENFIFGIFLLIASLRKNNVNHKIFYLAENIPDRSCGILTQFNEVYIKHIDKLPAIAYQKPEAFLAASELGDQYLCWIDGDCFVRGDISDFLFPEENHGLMIRFRSHQENPLRFSKSLSIDDSGITPETVFEKWKTDINENTEYRFETTTVNNCFTLDRNYLPLVNRWYDFMKQILERAMSEKTEVGFAYTHSRGFGLSDELALNAVLNFADMSIPTVGPYLLDQSQEKRLLHLGLNPKPWVRWSLSHYKYYDEIMDIIDWVNESGYQLPSLPMGMQRKYKAIVFIQIIMEPLHRLGKRVKKLKGRVILPKINRSFK